MSCEKIPNLIELDTFDGDYFQYEEAVYASYKDTFENHKFYMNGKPINHKKHPLYKGKPGTFWHIISNGPDEDKRTPNLRRYERIAWPAFILDYCKNNCSNILIWKNNRKGKSRIVLWCREIDYVVILDERADFFIFWTAYPVSYRHTREKLLKEYQEFSKSNT